ncbi:hypothetical protein [Pseudomonas jessenii]|uniref:hypothetical protein n=1 Tax=Pseudomonas jessenii TaxID=77298 RepID=UPI0038921A3C
MNDAKRVIERFEEEFYLDYQKLTHDFRNGLTLRVGLYGTAGPGGTIETRREDWGQRCFYMYDSEIIFTFETPVSNVEFSVFLKQEHERSWYRINEVGVPDSASIPIPATGGDIGKTRIVSFDSALGIESFVISHFNNNEMRLLIDNLSWA